MPPKAEVYRAAMRLIEQHGDAAEIAAMLRADPLTQQGEQARHAVIAAITELRCRRDRSKAN